LATPWAWRVASIALTRALFASSAPTALGATFWTPTWKLTVSGVPWTVPDPVTLMVAVDELEWLRARATTFTTTSATSTTTRIDHLSEARRRRAVGSWDPVGAEVSAGAWGELSRSLMASPSIASTHVMSPVTAFLHRTAMFWRPR